MADEADQSDEYTRVLTEVALAKIRANSAKRALSPSGRCHNCEEAFNAEESQRLFCDAYCRDDYEKRVAASRRNATLMPETA